VTVYLDASALVSWYVPDAHSARADALMHQHATPVVSDLALAETINAIIRRRKQGVYSPEVAARVLAKLDGHVVAGRFRMEALPREVYRDARVIAERVSMPLRTADALHLALTHRLGVPLATFDVVMRASATAEGITLIG
jgi:predicted nucleic acid-binding protein